MYIAPAVGAQESIGQCLYTSLKHKEGIFRKDPITKPENTCSNMSKIARNDNIQLSHRLIDMVSAQTMLDCFCRNFIQEPFGI